MKSQNLEPGTVLEHRDGDRVTLEVRKAPYDGRSKSLPFHPGWWLAGNSGGLADFVLDAEDSEWRVLAARR